MAGLARTTFPTLLLALIALAWGILAAPAHGQATQELPPDLEARAHALYKQIMCPVCAGQTLDQSRSQIAADMRAIVRERLLAGDSDEEILAFFVEAYDESILAAPPARGIGMAAWVIPPFAVALGAVAVYLAIRTLKRPVAPASAPASAASAPSGDIEVYLRLVDQEMNDGPARK